MPIWALIGILWRNYFPKGESKSNLCGPVPVIRRDICRQDHAQLHDAAGRLTRRKAVFSFILGVPRWIPKSA
jgi:hypothetical protein